MESIRIPSLPCPCSQKKKKPIPSKNAAAAPPQYFRQLQHVVLQETNAEFLQGSLPEAEQLPLLEEKKAGTGILLTLKIISASGSHFAGVVLALCITALAQTEIPRHSSLSNTTAPKGATSSRKFPGIQSVLGVIQAKKVT